DLLYLLVAPPPETGSGKFLSHHRKVAFANSYQILAPRSYLVSPDRWSEIESYWGLRETEAPPERKRIAEAWEQFRKADGRLWPAEP
ncbi:MAG TPA: hypothetical protein VJB88_16155, partial [Vicinamibacteria bacterium]|nr:hypothetical protein [Vicinamibacteria bacterium]